MQNQQVKSTENKVLTSHCKRKLIMVRFMAFSCRREKVLIDARGQTCLPRLGGSLFWLHACHCYITSLLQECIWLSYPLPALWLPLSACLLLKYTHVYLWIWKMSAGRRRAWHQKVTVCIVMQKIELARPFGEITCNIMSAQAYTRRTWENTWSIIYCKPVKSHTNYN